MRTEYLQVGHICLCCIGINLCMILFYSYKHAIDGVFRVWREEGLKRVFSGASTATSRAVVVTIGQLSFYDQVKVILLGSGFFSDNVLTHFLSSLSAVSFIFICG